MPKVEQDAADTDEDEEQKTAARAAEDTPEIPEDSIMADAESSARAAAPTHSEGIVQTIDNVHASLGDLANSRPFQSPYIESATRSRDAALAQPASTRGALRSSDVQRPPIDMAQIDALLALANGGSLSDSDDDDDETISEPSSEKEGPEEVESVARTDLTRDTEMEAVADNVVGRLASGRTDGRRDASASPASAHAENPASEQAARVRSDLSNAELVVNAVIPVAQGQALSRLYSLIAQQATPTNAASATAPSHQSPMMEARSPSARPTSQNAENAPSAGNSPRPGIFRTPAARRSAVPGGEQAGSRPARRTGVAMALDEATGAPPGDQGPEVTPAGQERKVRGFGFPPMANAPGGTSRKG